MGECFPIFLLRQTMKVDAVLKYHYHNDEENK